jgi:hypothetical protein
MLPFIYDCQRNVSAQRKQYEVISVNLSQKLVVTCKSRLKQLQNDVASLAENEERLFETQRQQMIQTLENNVELGIKQLELQAEHINSLALQLEAEMLSFQQLASEINPAFRQLMYLKNRSSKQSQLSCHPPISIWQIHCSTIPIVSKQRGVFIFVEKKVDLFPRNYQLRAELAQKRREKFENWLLQQRRF